ncbi:MAG: LptF/LptG family permease [Phycisphaeraceae bacterium]|nr:LptF/LptG family permease [Phycisphaeraceae bacterium]
MKTLDRYIIRLFLINFVILTAVLMLLFVVVDLIVDLDEFLKAGEAFPTMIGGRWGGTLWAIAGYYGPLLPLLYSYFSGLLVVGAMGFTLSAMQRNRELLAIVASGVSLFRITAPILAAGIALNALVLPVQEFVIPPLIQQLSRSKGHLSKSHPVERPVYLTADEHGNLLSAMRFDPQRGRLDDVTIIERGEDRLEQRHVRAESALWNADSNRWDLYGSQAVSPSPNSELSEMYSEAETVDSFETELSPTLLRARQQAVTMRLLSLSSLQSLQNNAAVDDQQRAQITQVLWSRFSMLVVNVLVLVLVLPQFLLKLPTHFVAQAAKAAVMSIGAWGSALLTVQVSTNLNPVASAWLSVVILLPLSAWMLQRVES